MVRSRLLANFRRGRGDTELDEELQFHLEMGRTRGIGIGVVVALGLTRFIESQLYGVSPTGPATFSAVVAVLLAVALLASYVPARRATRADPTQALRHE